MYPFLLVLLATVAGLLALAFWWIRRSNLAMYPAGQHPPALRPLPAGCDLGEKLLMAATDVDSRPPATQGGAPARKAPSGPSRRSFLRNMWGVSWLLTLGGFGGASLAFLWPDLRGGFGAEIPLPMSEDDLIATIRDTQRPFEFAPGRAYIVEYSEEDDQLDAYVELNNGAQVMALYWRCVHLGCKVPWCMSSQWLECPCHGSRYNRWGEWQAGPAPRGLDRFPVRLEDGEIIVNTGEIITGPSRQTPSLDQPPEGPTCV